jgi:hypothetical protein
MVTAGAGAEIFDKLEPQPELEPDKSGPAPQHWFLHSILARVVVECLESKHKDASSSYPGKICFKIFFTL